MPFINDDNWINSQSSSFDLSELEDCAIGVDASYYLATLLDSPPAHEPLLSALGGLTSIHSRINENLELWSENKITPFFIFDGQSVVGQDDVAVKRARTANQKTDHAWKLYSQNSGDEAVSTFGSNPGAFRLTSIFPVLQAILKNRNLHFIVAPYSANAQLAYFEMIDSDQCAGVMGYQELLMYPIKDCVIRNIDFKAKTVTAISKKRVLRALAVSESTFTDALLMSGTSLLTPFPPLADVSLYPQGYSVSEAANLLRMFDKSVANACSNFSDLLKQDAKWLEKYQKARLAAHHFIYIAESGQVTVNDFEHLTGDNHEYLGLQLPEELYHYLNTGLIGSRNLNCITHGQILIQPTLEGSASDEYKELLTKKIVPIKEQALGLIIPRVHRGIGHKNIVMRSWFDPKFEYTINHRALQPVPSQVVGSWDVKEESLREFFPADFAGPVYLEVLALANPDFVAKTIAKEKIIRGIDSADMIVSVAIWRFLHLRGYVNDEHKLTKWGNALATTLLALKDASESRPDMPALDEAALLAFELARFGVLHGKLDSDVIAVPRKGTVEEKNSLVLISRCASLLKLRHLVSGYTGPLNKSLLAFRSMSSAVREADRDLLEAIIASMFLFGQCKRERDDSLEISQKIPFLQEPDIGMGIAAWTFYDEDDASQTKAERAKRLAEFPTTFLPHAEALAEDMQICVDFFGSVSQGLQTLDNKEFPAESKAAWTAAQKYLDARPF